jgi:hypothetical protein
MTSSDTRLALLDFTCEHCQRGFVPPRPGKRSGGQQMVEEEDEAYQLFAQSVHICPECHQVVCHVCWNTPRGTCLRCASKAAGGVAEPVQPLAPQRPVAPMQLLAPQRPAAPVQPLTGVHVAATRAVIPTAPSQSGGFRRKAVRSAFTAAATLLVVGGGLALAATLVGPGFFQNVAGTTDSPAKSLAPASGTQASTATTAASDAESASAEPSASPTQSGTPKVTPTAKATKTPAPTAIPTATATQAPSESPSAATASPSDSTQVPEPTTTES